MNNVLLLKKPIGFTPLQLIREYQNQHPEYQNLPMTYAGRLDPMAEGLLLVLTGNEVGKKNQYLKLDKTYQFDVLLGIETDSYDSLGHLMQVKAFCWNNSWKKKLEAFLSKNLGSQQQQYPPFSSKPVQGKPLWWWSKEGRLAEITRPTHAIDVHSLKFMKSSYIGTKTVLETVINRIQSVNGDFSQSEILSSWEKGFQSFHPVSLSLLSFTIQCSSGFYVRQFCHDLGEYLQTGAIAWNIKRLQIGTYSL